MASFTPESASTYALAMAGAARGIYRYYIRPEFTARRTWMTIGALVAAHEVMCPPGELLSEGADRAIERYPVIVPMVTLALAGHVANLIPDRYDPIHQGFKAIKRS